METLTASSLKVLLENYRDKDRGFSFSTPKAAGFRLFGYQNYVNPRFWLSISLRQKTIQPICSAPALSSSESETSVQNEEIFTKDTTQSNTVCVKFQLRRECSFGQQFLIVGDDPIFGLWDPSNAVPLTWSEGHVWTIELDIPCDKVVKYKFILNGGSNAITWQPGPDRMLQTWETRNTITVCEDWENAEFQTIIEEDPVARQPAQSINNSELQISNENLLQPGGDPGNDGNEKPTITNGRPGLSTKPLAGTHMAMVADNITGHNEEVEVATGGISSQSSATHGANNFQNDEITLDSATGIPVLVPGLTPTAENEEAPMTETDKNSDADASLESGKGEELSVPKLNLEEHCSIGLSIPEEGTAMPLNDKPEENDEGHEEKFRLVECSNKSNDEEMENNVLDNDMKWGRRTLQKFLTTFGLL